MKKNEDAYFAVGLVDTGIFRNEPIYKNIDEIKNLHEFLKNHNQTFENWRYLYEYEEDGYSYNINFKLMDCFIKSLIGFINEFPRKPSFHLSKV